MDIVDNKAKFEHTRHLFRKNKIMFMHRISTKTPPAVFHPRFQRPSQSYPTNFSESNYSLPAHNLKKVNLEHQ